MSVDSLWNVRGVRREARETARLAARRAGMSVGEWLNSVILDAMEAENPPADGDREDPARATSASFRPRHSQGGFPAERVARRSAADGRLTRGGEASAQDLAEAMARLSRQLDRLTGADRIADMDDEEERATGARVAPRHGPVVRDWSDALDRAVNEIGPRSQADDERADAHIPDEWPIGPPVAERDTDAHGPDEGSVPDISGLERQLQSITTRLESLQRPSPIDGVVEVLRRELAAIGQAVVEAMPRGAVETLQQDVRALSERLEQGRRSGAEAAVLSDIERALAEMREALGRLVSAENLQGLTDIVRALGDKLDQVAAAGRETPVLHQLEAAISGLRGVLGRIASNEALAELAAEVRKLSVRVDRSLAMANGSNELLRTIDKRVAAIAAGLETFRSEEGRAVPAGIEGLLSSLHDKLDTLRRTPPDRSAHDRLEQRISTLLEKLDASEARLGRFEAVERGLSALLIQLEAMRSPAGSHSVTPDTSAVREAPVSPPSRSAGPRPSEPPGSSTGSFGDVIDRLAMIDAEMRRDARTLAAGVASVAPTHPLRAASPATPIEPALPPDHPLEPGSGLRAAADGARAPSSPQAVAANRAADAEENGRSSFIAAARRAARAAAASERDEVVGGRTESRMPRSAAGEPERDVGKLVKSLAVGAGVVVVTLGALRLGLYDAGRPDPLQGASRPGSAVAQHSAGEPARETPGKQGAPSAPLPSSPSDRAVNLASGTDPLVAGVPAAGTVLGDPPRGSTANAAAQAAKAPTGNEVTGSIAPPSVAPPPGRVPAGSDPLRPDEMQKPLPALLGALAQAAGTGNAAAAYELATRYAEGRGVATNLQEAAHWFERAAGQGLAPAEFRLGSLYEKGQGVKKDLQEARRLYLAAADKGNAKAMHNLAVLYAEGIDGKPDYKTAVQWFRMAADRGIADSQYNLGVLYARGIGIERNLVESFKWFTLAADHGDQDAAKKRDEVGARLDPPSLAAARQAVQAWKPKPQPEEATTVKAPPGGWEQWMQHGAPAKPMPRPPAVQKAARL